MIGTHRFLTLNGIRLHVVEAGLGPPVLLLHGFPEFWYAWRHQIPALAAAGFHAVAPDLRGYNESDRPIAIHHYRPRLLVEDVVGLIQQLSDGPVYLVGHDWGGVLAWRVAALYPHLVRKLVILNAPHPAARAEAVRKHPFLWLQSAYFYFFQFPALPEWYLRMGNFALLERMWRREPVHPGAFTDQDIALYKEAFTKPGGMTGPLNYYRAAFRFMRELTGPPQEVRVPTLMMWGERDPYLSVKLIEPMRRWVSDLKVELIPDASHWVQNDVPERVNRGLIDFIR